MYTYDALGELTGDDIELLLMLNNDEISLSEIYMNVDLTRVFRRLKQLNLVYVVEHVSLTSDADRILNELMY